MTEEKKNDPAAKWEATGILKTVPKKLRTETATFLENQRIYNEVGMGSDDPAFKRMSIPLCIRVFPNLESRSRGFVVTSELTEKFGNAVRLPIQLDLYSENNREKWEKYDSILDYEAEALAYLSERIRDAIDQMVYDEGCAVVNLKALGLDKKTGDLLLYADFGYDRGE